MMTKKVCHQFFIRKELSRQLDRIAIETGRSRSELLVEAIEAWFNRRNATTSGNALGTLLTRCERHVEAIRRQRGQWETLARLLRHHLLYETALPAADSAAQSKGLQAFEVEMDELADWFACKEPSPNTDPGNPKVRRLH